MYFATSFLSPSPLQMTIGEEISFEGVSLHSGKICKVSLLPAAENTGICFQNNDFPDTGAFTLTPACLQPSNLATIISPPDYPEARISTTEHFLAALRAFDIDNIRICVSGGEIPIQDGCAAFFVNILQKAGLKPQTAKRKWFKILREVHVSSNGASASLLPANLPELQIVIDFPAKAIGRQEMSCILSTDFFTKEIAAARTFVTADQLEQLRKMGLIKGGSLKNALVVNEDKIINPEGKRFENEFARHKLLDAIGDLYCAGRPILGRFEGEKSGHNLNRMLLQKTFSDSRNYEIVEAPSIAIPLFQTLAAS